MRSDLTRAVLRREEIKRLLRGAHATADVTVRERLREYLIELQTTQRYPLYRALRHPLYPIFRKIERIVEHIEVAADATAAGRVLYASNHKSHLDYLVELRVLDDHRIRPPVIAAGINMFGGPLDFLHRYITGAIPIRRATKDAVYLATLKAYLAETLKHHDLLFYPEGGRSYSGELKPPKTGVIHAALLAGVPLKVLPVAVAYDVVLEERALARQGVKHRQRPFSREFAELARYAVGYRSRAFVTFGTPISIAEYDAHSGRDLIDLAQRTMQEIGRCYKVLPTALLAAAMRVGITVPQLQARIAQLVERLQAGGANLLDADPSTILETGVAQLVRRGIIAQKGARIRVRERPALRYYARTIKHLLPDRDSAERAVLSAD